MDECNHLRRQIHRCKLRDGCLYDKHRHRSADFTPSADKKCRRQACMIDSSACGLRMTSDEKEKVKKLRYIFLRKRQPFHRPPAPRPEGRQATHCKKDSSARHFGAARNCSSPGGRRFFGTGKCWCGPGRMVPAATALFSFSPSFAGRGRARAPMRPPPGGPHHLPLPIGAVP